MRRFVIVSVVFSLCIFGHLFGRLFHRHCYGCGIAVAEQAVVVTPVVSAFPSTVTGTSPIAVQTLAIPSVAVVATPVVATPVVEENVIVKERRVNVRSRNARVRVFVR